MKTKFILSLLFLIGFSFSVSAVTASPPVMDNDVVQLVQKQMPTQVAVVNVNGINTTVDLPVRSTIKTSLVSVLQPEADNLNFTATAQSKPLALNRILTTVNTYQAISKPYNLENKYSWCNSYILKYPKPKPNQNLYLYQISRTIFLI